MGRFYIINIIYVRVIEPNKYIIIKLSTKIFKSP
jgi:hypothetical protein